MKVAELLADLEARGVAFSVEGDRIRFRAPKGVLSADDRTQLGDRRAEAVAAYRAMLRDRSERRPLSHAQQAIWLLQRMVPDSAANNLALAVRLRAKDHAPLPDEDALRRSGQVLVDRHPMLRTRFDVDATGELYQTILATTDVAFALEDARDLDEDALAIRVASERDRPFDLIAGPVFRLTCLRRDAEILCLLQTHHVVSDAYSMLVLLIDFLRELDPSFADPLADFAGTQSTYAEFIDGEAAVVAEPETDAVLGRWQALMSDQPAAASLGGDAPRPMLPSHRGGSIATRIDADVAGRIRALARSMGTTPFVILLTSFQWAIARAIDDPDVTVGTPVTSAREDRFLRVVGNFVNMLPVRSRFSWSMSFREAVATTRDAVLFTIESQHLPLKLIADRIRPERGLGAFPFFSAIFVLLQLEVLGEWGPLASGGGAGVRSDRFEALPFYLPLQAGQTDVTLMLRAADEGYTGSVDYAEDALDRSGGDAIRSAYRAILDRVLTDPDAQLMSADERQQILIRFNETEVILDEAPFPDQWHRAVEAAPDRVVLRFEGETIDALTLERRAARLAGHLRSLGAAPGMRVGVAMERSVELVVALLAIQKSGAAYVPFDPAFPRRRLAFMAQDAGISLLLTEGDTVDWLPDGQDIRVIDLTASAAAIAGAAPLPITEGPSPSDTAYILYTSGSTGQPNGVVLSHAALSNFLGAMAATPGLRAGEVLAAVTTVSFDIAAMELYLPLLTGAVIELVPRTVATDGFALSRLLTDSNVGFMQATPATWRLLVEAQWQPPTGFRGICTGEPLPADLAEALLGLGMELWNFYGPTETTIYSTGGQVTSAAAIDIGRPIANTVVYLLDTAGEPVPVGVTGSLWIGGRGLADGYHDRPALTATRFEADPRRPGERMYRTGDLARWLPDGRLLHLGREDDQVKIRGVRVELGEIETALASHPEIARAVVVPRGKGGDIRLVAYAVPVPRGEMLASEIRGYLRDRLPDAMIPAMILEMTDLPLTPTGKVNRGALPDPFANRIAGRAVDSTLRAGLETTLAEIWQDILNIEGVGPNDNFIELGGHSLLSLRVSAQLNQRTGLELPPRSLFFQTLRDIAEMLDTAPAKADIDA